jgi:hypothetical membrane protein
VTRLGQLVHREAALGGALLVLGSFQFIVSMIVVQLEYPGYSLAANYISDLGNPQLSPWALLYNISVRVLGVMGFLGFLLVRSAFQPGAGRAAGLSVLLLATVSAFLVGTFPENSPQLNGHIHGIVSALAFISSGAGLLILGRAILGDVRWDFYALFTVVAGLVTFVALAIFELDTNASTVGVWERLIVAPILLWALIAGAHIARLPRYPPSPFRSVPSPP